MLESGYVLYFIDEHVRRPVRRQPRFDIPVQIFARAYGIELVELLVDVDDRFRRKALQQLRDELEKYVAFPHAALTRQDLDQRRIDIGPEPFQV